MPIGEKIVSGKTILHVTYQGAKTANEMIQIFDQAVYYLLRKKEPCLILTDFTGTYITPPFMRHVEDKRSAISHLVKKNAFLGMSNPKKAILKGLRRDNHQAFNSEKEAIEFLMKEE